MNQNEQTRRIAASKLRGILSDLTDAICNGQDTVLLSLKDNTFIISLDGATLNITLNEEGGAL